MGTPGNGDSWPDNGGPHDELPDLPPDWGSIVIPDDASDLAAEAALVRRELRQQGRRAAWRRRFGLTPVPGGAATVPLRVPLIIMAVALLATLTSLFAVVWPGQQRQPTSPRTAASGAAGRTLPVLDLVAGDGGLVPLHSLLPAVIILVDDCTCADQVAAAVRDAPPGVLVVAVSTGRSTPSPAPGQSPAGAGPARTLADPAGRLKDFLQITPRPGTATTVLAARSGEVVRVVPATGSLADYPAELSQLGTR